jgi:hypothetical protein
MADAARSVVAAERPIAAVTLPLQVSPGQSVTLDAGASVAACGRSVAAFAWSVVTPATNPPAIFGADGAEASVIAPTSGSYTLRVLVTDDLGRTDAAEVIIESNRATTTSLASGTAGAACPTPVIPGATPGAATPVPTPDPPRTGRGGSGGGGGDMGLICLLALALLLGLRCQRPRIRRCN